MPKILLLVEWRVVQYGLRVGDRYRRSILLDVAANVEKMLIRVLAVELSRKNGIERALEVKPGIASDDLGNIGRLKVCVGHSDDVVEDAKLSQAARIVTKKIDVPRVKSDVVPHPLSALERESLLDEKRSRRARSFNFEAMPPLRVLGETEVVQHGRQEHQLAVALRAFTLREKLAEPIAPHNVIEKNVAGNGPC